ncbi:pyridoxal phosphate-dependent aminotransferase [Nocardia amamiensis]|uniref:pyridoxal phosphate-dependent aminotransferase n=1 Tax=Nocardia amamiensis TaxID=404578 RepID=UPI000B2B865F|nr:pyridoxal phosphate-dependent aminotransferase [Nocardia amamiensis]
MSRRSSSLGAVPSGTISLAMGEPFAGTDTRITEAAMESARSGNTRYEAFTGSPALRTAIATTLSEQYGRPIGAQEVVPTHGASAGLAAAILTLVDPGDRVVIPEPTYSLYADHVAMAGGQVDWVPIGPDGSLDLEAIGERIQGARLVILCNPGNPSGRILSRHEIDTVVAAAAASNCYLISDEAYCDIVFDGLELASALSKPEYADIIVCCRTFSKSFAMTGWRLGYVVAGAGVADAINLVHRTVNGALNSFVQHAGVTALNLADDLLTGLAEQYQYRRDLVVSSLHGIPGVHLVRPQGAFYAFPRVDMDISSDELTRRMADAGVLVRSGREYGPSGEGHFRISFATDADHLVAGMDRVRRVLEENLR